MKKISMMVIFILMVSMFATGCNRTSNASEKDEEKEVIKIGIIEPLSGLNSPQGKLEKEGFDLANELYPDVLGKEVNLFYKDSKSSKAGTENAVRYFVDKGDFAAVLGHWHRDAVVTAGPVLQQAGIPAISTANVDPIATAGNDSFFKISQTDIFEAEAMARYAFEQLGVKKIAIIGEAEDGYSASFCKAFEEKFRMLTGDASSIVANVNYTADEKKFAELLNSIKDLGAEAIYAPGAYDQTAQLIKQAREIGIQIPFLGTDTWEVAEFIEMGLDSVNGCTFTTFYDSTNAQNENSTIFLDAYKEKYGEDAEPTAASALAFDAYLLALDAIERAQSEQGPAVQEALLATKDFQGAAGLIDFNENLDTTRPAIIKIIEGDRFIYKATMNPA